jgi:hypothetical protein
MTMNRLIVPLLTILCVIAIPMFAKADPVQAAVVATETNAEVHPNDSLRSTGRRVLAVGEVYEVRKLVDQKAELKMSDTEVAIVPVFVLRLRSCTPEELSAAQAKFNALSTERQHQALKGMSDAKQATMVEAGKQAASLAGGLNSNCPIQRQSTAGAMQGIAASAASKATKDYSAQRKALREKNQTLAQEALAWAAAGD